MGEISAQQSAAYGRQRICRFLYFEIKARLHKREMLIIGDLLSGSYGINGATARPARRFPQATETWTGILSKRNP